MAQRFTQGLIVCLVLVSIVFNPKKAEAKAATIADFIVPPGFTFNHDLVKGTTTIPDVFFLQNILNMSTSTRVSENDKGANGKLTPYYGDLTQSAVGRFQQIFKNDINYEKSISTSTNAKSYVLNPKVVDQYTRGVLNKLIPIYNDQLIQYKIDNGTASSSATSTMVTIQTGADGTTSSKDSPEKTGFKYSPQGILLAIIGGKALVNKVYGYTPTGMMSGGGSGGGGSAPSSFNIGGGSGTGSGTGGTSVQQNFGGQTTSMVNCTCSFNILLYVKDARGMTLPLMYQPGVTRLYNNYRPTTGVNVLGLYTSGGQCLIYAGTSCSSGGSPIGTMTSLGTSLSI